MALTMLNLIDDNALGAPIRGRETPELQGWTSDAAYSLVPSTSVAVGTPARQVARFATLFVFGEEIVLDSLATRFNATLRAGMVVWTEGQQRYRLKVDLGEPGEAGVVLNRSA